MSNVWQVGFASEEICVPGATISGTAVGVAVVQATRGGILVRSLETIGNADLARRARHLCMDIGNRYDEQPRVCGPFQPGDCWHAPFAQCTPTVADLERLRALLEAGTVRLANGHEKIHRPNSYVAPALPMDPPVTAFLEARSAILAGGDPGPVGLALAAAVHGLDPIPDPPAAPAPMPGYSTGPR